MGFILQLLPLFAVVVISFACGYGVRELMSRRRREQHVGNSTKSILSSGRGETRLSSAKVSQRKSPMGFGATRTLVALFVFHPDRPDSMPR